MGKAKRKFNWKARQNQSDKVDVGRKKRDESESEISVQSSAIVGGNSVSDTDDPNSLILPSGKRKLARKTSETEPKVRKLSRKERKRLEKVLETKEKKLKRSSVLESLAGFQKVTAELKDLKTSADVFSGKRITHKSESDELVVKRKKGLRPVELEPEPELENENESESEDSDESEECDEMENTIETEETAEPNQEDVTETVEVKPAENHNEKADTFKSELTKKPARHVIVNRSEDIQQSRLKLPILAEEQVVMETINEHPVTIVCGATGSGKTTQIPQFLYEAGYGEEGMIGVTEPRRIAATSMSYRVAQELNLSTDLVSYQIRYEGNSTPKTKIKFMTDGVLLKAIQQDFLLSQYSVIILDEAHERSAFTDILIGLLSRIAPLREKRGKPLKLIIMSATLRVEDFTENRLLFKVAPPVVGVDTRQFPVTIHFNKITPEDYTEEAFRKVCKIHRMLPEGGILVFLTSQQEIQAFCRRLKRTFPGKQSQEKEEKAQRNVLPKINLDKYSIMPTDDTEVDEVVDDEEGEDDGNMKDDDGDDSDDDGSGGSDSSPLHVLPLFSLLSSQRQKQVFEPPPEGSRLCVVATNVAETSLTIPGIKYVVDCGKVKMKFYDKVTGVSTFRVTWVAQSSADQRAGRAGRLGPGHCYRLYSSAVFSEFQKFAEPEIVRRPVDDLILQMKELHIERVSNFPFPTPPARETITSAEESLIGLGALEVVPDDSKKKKDKTLALKTKITKLGQTMACFPVLPHFAKMLALAHQHDLLFFAVTVVSALSVQELFLESSDTDDMEAMKAAHGQQMQMKMSLSGSGQSHLLGDLMVLLKLVGAYDYDGGTSDFCVRWGVRHKAMNEIRKLRQQLTNSINSVLGLGAVLDARHAPPTNKQCELLRQIVLAGAGRRVARRLPEPTSGSAEEKRKLRHGYRSMQVEDPVFIHPKSVLYKTNPEYVVYQELQESGKMYMKAVSAVDAEWLPRLAPQFAQFSKPEDEPWFDGEQVYCHRSCTYGPWSWEIPRVSVPYPEGLDKYKWFAVFFLDGLVCKKLAKYVPLLLSKPQTMVKSWAKLQPRTESVLSCLASRDCDRKSVLVTLWKKEPKFLLREYLEWIPESCHRKVEADWPPD